LALSEKIDNTEKSNKEFWLQRWREGDIGWHHQEINPHLLSFWHTLGMAKGSRVFVPLCGKSRDMIWLVQQGHSIVGVEISEIAVREFFSEQDLIAKRSNLGPFQQFQVEDYQLLCGDIFQLKHHHVTGIDAVYDRASLVALNASQRQAYAKVLADILPAGCSVLLVSMDYPQNEMNGPPYAVKKDEVRVLFESNFQVTHLHSLDLLKDTDRYSGMGLSSLSEHIYKLQRN
jgi:thiopurine S-methyltransferase